uniref:BHLH domain-containing protein n=1 Tax=Rhabditophanes sp. KR3021 TaxID=114890 RepID=A0AC35TT45_9BILA
MSSSPTSIYSSPKSNSSGHLSCGPLPIQYLNEDFEPYVRRRKRGENVKGQKNKIAELDETEQVIVRTCINSRERKRMHDLNDAFEKLRKILAYDKHASSRKASKINTLLLAGNW